MNKRKDFGILNKCVIYFDNAATSLRPDKVIEAMNKYYSEYNANIHRGLYKWSEKATEEFENAKKKVAKFINADFEEVIFTRGTTESLNLLAYSLLKDLKAGDEIVLTEMEHHSNLVPWQQLAKEKGIIVRYIKVKDFELKLNNEINDKTKIVAVTHMSNVLGTINDVKGLAKIAHKNNALIIVDGAQSISHLKIDVKDLDVDFIAFSGHKMYGPTGIGVLYGKKELLERMNPFMYGGDMVREVSLEDSSWNELPWKFEAGTPNIAGAIGLGYAVDYLSEINDIKDYEEDLTKYALEKLGEIDGIEIYGKKDMKNRGSVISFNLKGVHPHDVASIFDKEGIAIRGGHMCAMPLVVDVLKQVSVNRASLAFYNTKEEIDKFIDVVKKIKEIFGV